MDNTQQSTPAQSATTNRHVLIIDDNESIHEDYRRILAKKDDVQSVELRAVEDLLFGDAQDPGEEEPLGFDLEHALSGREGLEKLKSFKGSDNPISLAFVDMRMPPGWNGLETIERLWHCDPQLQIVICSAYSDVSWETIRRQFGKRDNLLILRKPFEPEEVQQLASSLTEKWDQEVNGKTIYTVAPEYPLRLVEVKAKEMSAPALVCEAFAETAESEAPKRAPAKGKDMSKTPTRALELFIEKQQSLVDELIEKVSIESGKLDQARLLLQSLEVADTNTYGSED